MPEAVLAGKLFALAFHFFGFFVQYHYHGMKFWDAPDPNSVSANCTLFLEASAAVTDVIGFLLMLFNWCCHNERDEDCRDCCQGNLLCCCFCSYVSCGAKILGCALFAYYQTYRICWSCCLTLLSGFMSGGAAACCQELKEKRDRSPRRLLPS